MHNRIDQFGRALANDIASRQAHAPPDALALFGQLFVGKR
jgi:hypothetical protein